MSRVDLLERDLAVLRDAFRRFPFVREVRLFGSRATGSARRASDVDLAVSAPAATADDWLGLVEAIEATPIVYEFDLVRMERVQNPRLAERVAREGVTIYSESPTESVPDPTS
ncbi:MAG: nucleotidyltransferase domain-containing protein [Fimbriimonadaceae bacterium]|nr:nucleotidyltransferase domain-containing protein [Fimbriimonadaceae bacterium]